MKSMGTILQYKKLGRWLGFERFPCLPDGLPNLAGFIAWLWHAIGRCSIEDRFLLLGEEKKICYDCTIDSGDPSVGQPRQYIIEEHDYFNDKHRLVGFGDTANEAWIAAAIKISDEVIQ